MEITSNTSTKPSMSPVQNKTSNQSREGLSPVDRIRALEAVVFGARTAPTPSAPFPVQQRQSATPGLRSTPIK